MSECQTLACQSTKTPHARPPIWLSTLMLILLIPKSRLNTGAGDRVNRVFCFVCGFFCSSILTGLIISLCRGAARASARLAQVACLVASTHPLTTSVCGQTGASPPQQSKYVRLPAQSRQRVSSYDPHVTFCLGSGFKCGIANMKASETHT